MLDFVTRPELDRSWVKDSACSEPEGELFFPIRGENPKDAKAICARCPVQEECLEYALANGERFGVWGGKSEKERRRIRSLRRRQAQAR